MPQRAASSPEQNRYGRPRNPRRRLLYSFTAIALAMAIAWTAWAALDYADRPVTWQTRTFEALSDNEVTISFEINRPGGPAIECEVYAQASDHRVVGEDVVEIPEGHERMVVTTEFRTSERAVIVVVNDCTVAD